MKMDEFQLLRMEHDTDVVGAVGDSCAETFRLFILKDYLGESVSQEEIFSALGHTNLKGHELIRHPLCERSWGFGPDQWLPRYVFCELSQAVSHKWMREYQSISDANTFTYAATSKSPSIAYFQTVIFKLSKNTSNYLNWLMLMIYFESVNGGFWFKKALANIDPQIVMARVESYYLPETKLGYAVPALPLYEKAISKLWANHAKKHSANKLPSLP